MRQQLRNWLDLSLNHSLPSSLLILSRAFIGSPNLNPLEAVLVTLYSLPYELKLVGVASLPSNNPIEDNIRKLKCLDLQEARIKEDEKKELLEMKQSHAIQDNVALKEMTISMLGQARARAVDKQEHHLELISNALTVLASALNVFTECEKFSRLFSKEGVAMLPNLDKELDDVGAKTGGRWQVLDRYCDGKVSLDVVAAATFLKDTLDKEGIQELLSNLRNYKDEMMQESVSEKMPNSDTSDSARLASDTKTMESSTDPKMPESDISATDPKMPESEFGLDYKHWFVQVKLPDGEMSRDEIINFYIGILASVVGSDEEAKMKIYSVSTVHYYAFGANISEELSSKLRELPQVLEVDPDCYINKKNKDYGGEPFENGHALPYDRKYHASYWRMRRARVDPPTNMDDGDQDDAPVLNRYDKWSVRRYTLFMLRKKWRRG